MFINYSLRAASRSRTSIPTCTQIRRVLGGNPFLADSLLARRRAASGPSARSRRASSTTRSTTRSSRTPASATRVDRRRRPRRQHEVHQSARRRRSGTSTHTKRTSLGFRGAGRIHPPYGDTERAADLREAVPRRRVQRPRLRHPHHRPARPGDPASCIGGNKSLLFNAEYLIKIAGPVRLVLFYDAGQVRDVGEKFVWKEPIYEYSSSRTALADRSARSVGSAARRPDASGRRRSRSARRARSRPRPARRSASSCRC